MGYNITFVTVLFIVFLMAASFTAGIWLAERFNRRAQAEQKEALQRQYMRLKTDSDADDPCRPYGKVYNSYPTFVAPINNGFSNDNPNSDYEGPISPEFMQELRETGKAKTQLRKDTPT